MELEKLGMMKTRALAIASTEDAFLDRVVVASGKFHLQQSEIGRRAWVGRHFSLGRADFPASASCVRRRVSQG